MSLDEIERILTGVADGRTPDTHGRRVLRAALALLPVFQAAENWRDYGPGQSHCEEEDCPCTSAECRLKIAITTARSAMGRA